MEFISDGIFGKYKKIYVDFGFKISEKGYILRPFSCIAPTKMKYPKRLQFAAYGKFVLVLSYLAEEQTRKYRFSV